MRANMARLDSASRNPTDYGLTRRAPVCRTRPVSPEVRAALVASCRKCAEAQGSRDPACPQVHVARHLSDSERSARLLVLAGW
jgi:hypothetical protein